MCQPWQQKVLCSLSCQSHGWMFHCAIVVSILGNFSASNPPTHWVLLSCRVDVENVLESYQLLVRSHIGRKKEWRMLCVCPCANIVSDMIPMWCFLLNEILNQFDLLHCPSWNSHVEWNSLEPLKKLSWCHQERLTRRKKEAALWVMAKNLSQILFVPAFIATSQPCDGVATTMIAPLVWLPEKKRLSTVLCHHIVFCATLFEGVEWWFHQCIVAC